MITMVGETSSLQLCGRILFGAIVGFLVRTRQDPSTPYFE